MARLLRNNGDEALEGNIYYWKIPKLFPHDDKKVWRQFKLHGTTWIYAVFVEEGFLYARINSLCSDKACLNRLFDIRVGIVGDDLKEIAAFYSGILSKEKLMSSSELDSMLVTNKFLYLFAEIRRKCECSREIKVRKGKQKMEADFRQLLYSGKNSDMTIEVKHKRFKCHSCILGVRSPVFAAMFEHDMKEKASGIVTIEDAEPDVFQEFLLYLYTGNDDFLSWEYVADLYKLADKYGVEDIKYVCRDDIKRNIDQANFFPFFKLSRLYNDSALKEIVIQFFLKESKEIVRRENWVTYLSEDPVECNILITALADKLPYPYNNDY